jgi:hypothetical protein
MTECLHDLVTDSVRAILGIARETLVRHGTHLPTAVLHTLQGLIPIVLPFKDDEQKRALVDYVKRQAIETHAFAVTTVTNARICNSRTGGEQECLVLATVIQRGSPQVLLQHYSKDEQTGDVEFGEAITGDEAIMPGQMMIFPDWEEETCH